MAVPVTHNQPVNPTSPHGDPNQQYIPWLQPKDVERRSCCGRCNTVPRYYEVLPRWESALVSDPPEPSYTRETSTLPPDYPYLLPDDNKRYLFDNICVQRREPIYRLSADQIVDIDGSALPYTVENNRCFWRSKQFTEPDTLWEIHWYLFYGDSATDSSLGSVSPNSLIRFPSLEEDSKGETAGGEFDQPPTYLGWTLLLLRRILEFETPGNPTSRIITRFHWYGSWQLKPLEEVDGFTDTDQPKAIFNCLGSNEFTIVHNSLLFPAHTILVQPFWP